MTTAIIRYARQPGMRIYSLTARGHAGYRNDGSDDIVCASVSITVQALAEAARQMAEGKEAEKAAFTKDSLTGYEVTLRVRDGNDVDARKRVAKATAVFWMAEVALSMLSQAYPEHVTLMVV